MPSKYGFTTQAEKDEQEARERKKYWEEHERINRILLPIADRIDKKVQDIFKDYFSTQSYKVLIVKRLPEFKCTWEIYADRGYGEPFYWYAGIRVKNGNPVFIILWNNTNLNSVLARETGLQVLYGSKEDLGWFRMESERKTYWSY